MPKKEAGGKGGKGDKGGKGKSVQSAKGAVKKAGKAKGKKKKWSKGKTKEKLNNLVLFDQATIGTFPFTRDGEGARDLPAAGHAETEP